MPGNKQYEVEYLDIVVKRDIPALSASIKKKIKKAIEDRLQVDPIGFGKPLRYSLKGHRRLRVGNYRVVFRIDAKLFVVIVVAIKHRKEVYKDFS